MTCTESRKRVALYVGGELDRNAADLVRSHSETCSSCRLEIAEYEEVITMMRRSFEAAQGLADHVRARIARTASEDALRPSWWRRILPVFPSQALATVIPAALVLLALALPIALRTPRMPMSSAGPVRIDMQAEGGTVRLAWIDGRGKPYRVFKSSNPRLLGSGPAEEVRGNEWVDNDPDSSPIVFYRVE